MPETEDQPTEAERKDAQRSKGTMADMARALDPILYPHLNPLTQGWPRLMQITTQVCVVFRAAGWVGPEEAKAREAAARREALLEAADALPRMTEGDERIGTRRFPPLRRDAYSLAIEEAQGALRALAEPERDEEGGR